jgi:hypothetical protein
MKPLTEGIDSKIKRGIQTLLGRSDIYFGASLYMERWMTPRFWNKLPRIRLHHIMRSDSDREMHDHPFDFTSIILSGGYTEHRPDGSRRFYGPGSIVRRKAEDLHRLELDVPAWTICITGPKRRDWGFMRDGVWTRWQDFVYEREQSLGAIGEPPPDRIVAPSSLHEARQRLRRIK